MDNWLLVFILNRVFDDLDYASRLLIKVRYMLMFSLYLFWLRFVKLSCSRQLFCLRFVQFYCSCLVQLFLSQLYSYFPHLKKRDLIIFLVIFLSPNSFLRWGYTITIKGNVSNVIEMCIALFQIRCTYLWSLLTPINIVLQVLICCT